MNTSYWQSSSSPSPAACPPQPCSPRPPSLPGGSPARCGAVSPSAAASPWATRSRCALEWSQFSASSTRSPPVCLFPPRLLWTERPWWREAAFEKRMPSTWSGPSVFKLPTIWCLRVASRWWSPFLISWRGARVARRAAGEVNDSSTRSVRYRRRVSLCRLGVCITPNITEAHGCHTGFDKNAALGDTIKL